MFDQNCVSKKKVYIFSKYAHNKLQHHPAQGSGVCVSILEMIKIRWELNFAHFGRTWSPAPDLENLDEITKWLEPRTSRLRGFNSLERAARVSLLERED